MARRVSVSMPDEVADILQDEAKRQGIAVSEFMRRMVLQELGLTDGARRSLGMAQVGRGTIDNLSQRVDDYLGEHWLTHLRREKVGP